MSDFLTGPQLCQLLEITTSQLSSLVHRKTNPLPSVSVSNSNARRFPVVGLVQWVASNANPPVDVATARSWLPGLAGTRFSMAATDNIGR